MFVRTAVAASEHNRLHVMLHGRPKLPEPAIGVADVVLDIGILGSRSTASLSAAMAAFQSSATSAFLPAAKSGSSCAPVGIRPHRCHRRADRPVFLREDRRCRRLGAPNHAASTFCIAGWLAA